jgi:hypothetical protein
VDVVATDLPCVLPLLQANAARCGGLVRALSLPWGAETALEPDVVLCCECLYWGGWDLLHDDTRAPLRRTLRALTLPHTVVFLAFTVRDAARELGFVRSLLDEDGFSCRCAAVPGCCKLRQGHVHIHRVDLCTHMQVCARQCCAGGRARGRRAAARVDTFCIAILVVSAEFVRFHAACAACVPFCVLR